MDCADWLTTLPEPFDDWHRVTTLSSGIWIPPSINIPVVIERVYVREFKYRLRLRSSLRAVTEWADWDQFVADFTSYLLENRQGDKI